MPCPPQGATIGPGWWSLGEPRAPIVRVVYGEKIDSGPRWVSHILPGLGRVSSVMSRAPSLEWSGAGGKEWLTWSTQYRGATAAHPCPWDAWLPSGPGVQTVRPASSQKHAAALWTTGGGWEGETGCFHCRSRALEPLGTQLGKQALTFLCLTAAMLP